LQHLYSTFSPSHAAVQCIWFLIRFLTDVGDAKGTVGSPADEHDHLLRREYYNFLKVLAGVKGATTGVTGVDKEAVRVHEG